MSGKGWRSGRGGVRIKEGVKGEGEGGGEERAEEVDIAVIWRGGVKDIQGYYNIYCLILDLDSPSCF